jgi:glycosyltransferase involved in cell wall biosynthesis
MLSNMDGGAIKAKVICRKKSDIQEKYAAAGIETAVEPDLPLFSPTETGLRRNLSLVKNSLPNLLRRHKKFDHLGRDIEENFDLVHFNHVSLFVLAARLRSLTKIPFSMHIRTRPGNTFLTRLQARSVTKSCGTLVYITDNERTYFAELAGQAPGSVILNPTNAPEENPTSHPGVPDDGRLKIASLKSFSPTLGHTRLVDVAQAIADAGEADKILFVMAGDMALWPSLPGDLGEVGAKGGTFKDYVRNRGLEHLFLFLGWVPDPERVLAACDILAAPGFENNPWGRDIIEAYALGKPVIATGTWDTFVKNGRTGLLTENFEAEKFARDILHLSSDRDRLKHMGETGKKNITTLCSPPDRARDLLELWQSAARR